jgi:phosphoglycerate kinase
VAALSDGDVALLENVRFEPGETSKDDAERGFLADRLAGLADAFVSTASASCTASRPASTTSHSACRTRPARWCGPRWTYSADSWKAPERPFVVVLGGSKVSDKLGVIDALLGSADALLIGGGMMFTFLAAQGYPVGRSLLEEDQIEAVRGYLDRARTEGVRIMLPTDVVVAPALEATARGSVVPADQIPDDQLGLDIGPDSSGIFGDEIRKAATVFWNGPMGVFEIEQFALGTKAVAEALTECAGLTVVGGGDSAAAVRTLGFGEDAFTHISTGGGASLELLEGRPLPGLTVLED